MRTNIFRLERSKDAIDFSYTKMNECVQRVAPLISSTLKSIAVNPRNNRCKSKNSETVIPALMTSLSILLYTRNRLMNALPFIQTCICRRGQAKKEVFGRFV